MAEVGRLVADRLEKIGTILDGEGCTKQLMPGKMLRTRLAARLVPRGATRPDHAVLRSACAAIELAHTASLCHDDVIDNALMRRAMPVLWRATSTSSAVLIGDLLLCEAIELLLNEGGGRHLELFVSKVREVCVAETEQELKLRGKGLDEETCLQLARGKTGPFFAFVGRVCGDEHALSLALEEAGYRIGTAYQLADDLLDVTGSERVSGKTLGTDLGRGSFTLAQDPADGSRIVREHVARLCRSALSCVAEWPEVKDALAQYLVHDLQPVFDRQLAHLDIDVRLV